MRKVIEKIKNSSIKTRVTAVALATVVCVTSIWHGIGNKPIVNAETTVAEKTYLSYILDRMIAGLQTEFTILEIVPNVAMGEFRYYTGQPEVTEGDTTKGYIGLNNRQNILDDYYWHADHDLWYNIQDPFSNFGYQVKYNTTTNLFEAQSPDRFLNYVLPEYKYYFEDRIRVNTVEANDLTAADIDKADFIIIASGVHDSSTIKCFEHFSGKTDHNTYVKKVETVDGVSTVTYSQVTTHGEIASASFNGYEKVTVDGTETYISRDMSWEMTEKLFDITLNGKKIKLSDGSEVATKIPVILDNKNFATLNKDGNMYKYQLIFRMLNAEQYYGPVPEGSKYLSAYFKNKDSANKLYINSEGINTAYLDITGTFAALPDGSASLALNREDIYKIVGGSSSSTDIYKEANPPSSDFLTNHHWIFNGDSCLVPSNIDTKLNNATDWNGFTSRVGESPKAVDVMRFLLGAVDDPVVRYNRVRILEVEPCTSFTYDNFAAVKGLAQKMLLDVNGKIKDAAGNSIYQPLTESNFNDPKANTCIYVECMSSSAFNGINTDIVAEYDAILFGMNDTLLLKDTNGKTIYNDTTLDGYVYLAYGDWIETKTGISVYYPDDYVKLDTTNVDNDYFIQVSTDLWNVRDLQSDAPGFTGPYWQRYHYWNVYKTSKELWNPLLYNAFGNPTDDLVGEFYTDSAFSLSGSTSVANPFKGNANIYNGVAIEFDVEGTGSALSNILSFTVNQDRANGGTLYFTGGSYLGYNNDAGSYYDANLRNYSLVKDYINGKATIRIELTTTGFVVYANGVRAYYDSILDTNAGSYSGIDHEGVLKWLKDSAKWLNFGKNNWWADKFNGKISNVKCYVMTPKYILENNNKLVKADSTVADMYGDKAGNVRLSGNDITQLKANLVKEYMDAGKLVIFGDDLYNYTDASTTVFKTSNMAEIAKYAIDGNKNRISEDDIVKMLLYLKNENPVLNFVDPENDLPTEIQHDANNRVVKFNKLGTKLPIKFEVKGKPNTDYKVNIYVDKNNDGVFDKHSDSTTDDNEIFKESPIKTNADGYAPVDASTELSENYSGLISYKIEVVEMKDGVEQPYRAAKTGYTAIKGDTVKDIKVLQILPIPYDKKVSHLNMETDTQFNSLLTNAASIINYNIDVDTMYTKEYEEEFNPATGGLAYDNTNAETRAATNFLAEYDMVVLGFSDLYCGDDISNDYGALTCLNDFIDAGKSVLFTHDTISYANSVNGMTYTTDGTTMTLVGHTTNNWGTSLSRMFRNKVGMDRFGITVAGSEAELRNAPVDLSGKIVYGLQGVTNMLAYRHCVATETKDTLGVDFVTKRPNKNVDGTVKKHMLYPYTTGSISNYEKLIDTTQVKKLNEGQVTMYPYYIPDNLTVAETHSQWYQLDLEDDDIVVWYTLAGDNVSATNDQYYKDTDKDAANNYYIYSKGNITYSGAGHSEMDSPEELKLFVNTVVKAITAGNNKPEVKVIDGSHNAGTYTVYITPYSGNYGFTYYGEDLDLRPYHGEFKLASVTLTSIDTDGDGDVDEDDYVSLVYDAAVNADGTFKVEKKTLADGTTKIITAQHTGKLTSLTRTTINIEADADNVFGQFADKINFIIDNNGEVTFNIELTDHRDETGQAVVKLVKRDLFKLD